jgi:ferredoxin-NADP reductase
MLEVGSLIEARMPAGQFTIDPLERRPAVLLGAGVGVTPMLAMLRHIVHEGLRTRRVRPTTLFYSARTLGERAFSHEISELARAAKGKIKIIRTLTNSTGARETEDFDAIGRLDLALICRTLRLDDYDFYMCGPPGFMQAIYDGLRNINIADERIYAEAFGPSGLARHKSQTFEAMPTHAPSVVPVPVAFVTSGKEARWTPESGSLLDLAESRGLFPEYGCRSGSCGTCRSRVLHGTVAYASRPAFHVPDNEALICCAVPASAEIEGYDRLLLDV